MRSLLAAAAALVVAAAQAPSSAPPSVSVSLMTSSVTITVATRSASQNTVVTTVIPAVVNVTYTMSPTPSFSSSSSVASSPSPSSSSPAAASASATPAPIELRTVLDPAFGVLGGILIITGLPSAFWGHKNRWTSFFLIGFYTLSLVCAVLILKFGVLQAVNPPSKTLRGMYVLASTVTGIAGGAVAIFFWKAARYGIGAWGGFAFALWIQCFQNGGVIKPTGLRWILYIGCGVIGFVLCALPKIHYHVLLISTAFVGSSAFMLGVDCFTAAGLKEFYIWNLGLSSLFPKYVNNAIAFPVTQTMQIELGLIGAVALMGIAVQLRILRVLKKKLHEISAESQKRDEEAEFRASEMFRGIESERFAWEKDHPTLSKHERQGSALSVVPLMRDGDGSNSSTADRPSSYIIGEDGRPRYLSGVSDFKTAPLDDDSRRASRHMQSPGVLPTLDLGQGIKDDVPSSFIAAEESPSRIPVDTDDRKRKQDLMAEILTIRKSIDLLKSETPLPSSSEQSRRPSLASRRTLSVDASTALRPSSSHMRPPREKDPRSRSHSVEYFALTRNPALVDPISRPTSMPLQDPDYDWDLYIQERRLLQPPFGPSAPIAATPIASLRAPVPTAVQEALNRRRQREGALVVADQHSGRSSDDIPLVKVAQEKQSSTGGNIPVTILPPRRQSGIISSVAQQPVIRTRTFEELNEKHREKLHDMQAPLTQAEQEHADIEAARQRWGRAKALEKDAVTRRQAEKAAAQRKRASEQPEQGSRSRWKSHHGHRARSLSADRLTGFSSRRLSMLKVENWQRMQQDLDKQRSYKAAGGAQRNSNTLGSGGVPFPDTGNGAQFSRRNQDILN